MDPKPIWRSRTFWVNALTAAVAALGALAGHEWIAQNPKLVGWIVFGIGVLGALLRLITTQPVTVLPE